jgi:hypothetical protein
MLISDFQFNPTARIYAADRFSADDPRWYFSSRPGDAAVTCSVSVKILLASNPQRPTPTAA